MKYRDQLNAKSVEFDGALDEKHVQMQREMHQDEQTLDILEQSIKHNLSQQEVLVIEKNSNERQIQLKKEVLNVLHQQKPGWWSLLFKRPKALAYKERKNALVFALVELLNQHSGLEEKVHIFQGKEEKIVYLVLGASRMKLGQPSGRLLNQT